MTTAVLKRILVPTDFSETAIHALRYASDLARGLGARLTIVYSDLFAPPIDYTATIGGWEEASFENLKVVARQQLLHDAEANVDPAVPYDIVVRVALPLDGIIAQARESGAGLIVMGTHGRTGFRRLVIGSVTEAVMRRAEVPVIAVPPRGEATPSIKTIVCPVIYNAQCLDALTFAAQIAPPDARFIVIRATPSDEVAEPAGDLFELHAWVPEAIAARCELRMVDNEQLARQIDGFAASAHADLIVAAEPADRTAADVLHGTFAARLVQHSECPVLSVNGPTARVASRIAKQEERTDAIWATP
jgi:Universal stress protein UspA and related nucleotide-binding proteins